MFYSKKTGGFYSREIHGDNIPADAVAITNEQHASLLAAQSSGKIIAAGEDGMPIAVNPPQPTPEQLQANINAEARAYLASSDWYVTRFAETGIAVPEDIAAARQSARESIVEVPV